MFRYLFLIALLYTQSSLAKPKVFKDRSKVGPTFTSPVEYKGDLYFLAATGVLYKTDKLLKSYTPLFETNVPSMSPLVLDGNRVYYGEGVHSHKETLFHVFNLDTKKEEFSIKVDGHVERAALITKNEIVFGAGGNGLHIYSKKDGKLIKKVTHYKKQALHVDSNIIEYKNNYCFSSIYSYKAILCIDKKTRKIKHSFQLNRSPKSELAISGNYLHGYATDADIISTKFNTKSDFFSIDLEKMKMVFKKELRGYSFFSPLALKSNNEVFVTLSTGDLITINLSTGKIGYVGEFPEPFVSSPFKMGKELCSIGLMGKLLCYKKIKDRYAISKDKRYYETISGVNSKVIDGRIYIPTRVAYIYLESKL